MRFVVIVQARMGSSRLPGKVLKTVLGKPLLSYQIKQLKHLTQPVLLVIATSRHALDDPIEKLCQKEQISCYRGSEENVLERYFEAAKFYRADWIIRLTADCPLIDPLIIDDLIGFVKEDCTSFDYVSNTLERTYTHGMDTEIFSYKALERAYKEAKELQDLEHVTRYFYTNPEKFRLKNVCCETNNAHNSCVVDTEEDFFKIQKLIEDQIQKDQIFHEEQIIQFLEKMNKET